MGQPWYFSTKGGYLSAKVSPFDFKNNIDNVIYNQTK